MWAWRATNFLWGSLKFALKLRRLKRKWRIGDSFEGLRRIFWRISAFEHSEIISVLPRYRAYSKITTRKIIALPHFWALHNFWMTPSNQFCLKFDLFLHFPLFHNLFSLFPKKESNLLPLIDCLLHKFKNEAIIIIIQISRPKVINIIIKKIRCIP